MRNLQHSGDLKLKSIAFFNNKGGVGKTTLICNTAAYMALNLKLKVCVVDADPQCNATQYFFNDDVIEEIYRDKSKVETIQNVMLPLQRGEGYSGRIATRRAKEFGVDVILGDPRLALAEDLLATDWGSAKSGDPRGMKTSLVFDDLLRKYDEYDIVLFDVSPSLGAINRAILLSCDFFLSPVSIDIFSLRAFENIASWISGWSKAWERGIEIATDNGVNPDTSPPGARFLGYVTQQYLAKRDSTGRRRAVNAYERIRTDIDDVIAKNFPSNPEAAEIGTVPNLFSLVPMSQSSHKPVFGLQASDGVVGAHFSKVKESSEIFGDVAKKIVELTK
jgi:cellulose biosynthesis protein BcsQ